MQELVAGVIVLAWLGSGILAAFDGHDLLRIVTPLATLAIGWVFTGRLVGE